jgi:DNA polymerase III alpha subunit
LVAAARAGGYEALALTDRNNLYAAVPFVALARAAGLQPILGVELDEPGPAAQRAILLARNAEGYRSLSRLVTRRRLDPAFALAPRSAAKHRASWSSAAIPISCARCARCCRASSWRC